MSVSKYPAHVINKYLSAIHFAGIIELRGFYFGGTVDSTRRVVYLVDDGTKSGQEAMGTFHHEFSSLLLARHGLFLNPWLEQYPEGLRYKSQMYENSEDVYADTSLDGTESFDAFIQIDDIEGESTDARHAGWIEVLDYDLSVGQRPSSTAGGGAAGNSAAGWDLQRNRRV